MERAMGIEPTLAAWEAAVLPLNYTRKNFKLSFRHVTVNHLSVSCQCAAFHVAPGDIDGGDSIFIVGGNDATGS
jgi:hypothetical protein